MCVCCKWWGCMCQNPTLGQLSLCTLGRLNNVAPWPVPPALGPDSPDPEAPLSLLSLPPHSLIFLLILIQPGVPFCFIWPAGLRHSRSSLRATVVLKYSLTTQNHIISMCPGRQLHQIEHVSLVGGSGCFPVLGAARPVSSEPPCYSLSYYCPRENRSPPRDWSEAKLHGFW